MHCFYHYRELIKFTEDSARPDWKGYIMASAFLAVILIQSFTFHQLMFQSINLGLRVRSVLISAIFKKVSQLLIWECSGSVVETEGPQVRASPASLRCGP